MNDHRNSRGRIAGSSILAAGMVASLVAGGVLGIGVASAGADTSPPPNTAAIVAPLLHIFSFGDTTGLPLACDLTSSLAGNVQGSSPVVQQINTLCGTLATQGANYLQQAITASSSITFINPILDPVIADLSSTMQTVGNNYGPSLAPFGPTVAGLGGTVAFFEGS